MTEAGRGILSIFKRNRKHTIAGNREYWEELYYQEGKIIHAGGQTFGNTEDFREVISEDEAIEKIKAYFSSKAWVFEKMELVTDEEVLEYWKKNPYI